MSRKTKRNFGSIPIILFVAFLISPTGCGHRSTSGTAVRDAGPQRATGQASALKTVIYDISGLVVGDGRIIHSTALGIVGENDAVRRGHADRSCVAQEELLAQLYDLAPSGPWAEDSIIVAGDQLAVRQTPEVQKKVQQVLNKLLAEQSRALRVKSYCITGLDLRELLQLMGKKARYRERFSLSPTEIKDLLDRVARVKKATVIHAPEIVTMNRSPAVIRLTDDAKTFTSWHDEDGKQVKGRIRTGLVFEMTPVVSSDRESVTLRLRVVRCELLRMDEVQTQHGVEHRPILNMAEVKTYMWLRDGHSAVVKLSPPSSSAKAAPTWAIIEVKLLKWQAPTVKFESR